MGINYLRNADAFLAASRQFQRALDTDENMAESVDELERTANLAGEAGFRSFRFAGDPNEPASGGRQSPQEETVGLLFEIQAATVLLAAGRALEEAPAAKPASAELRQAVTEFETALNELSRPWASPAGSRFSAENAGPAPGTAGGADLVESFRARSKATLETLITGAHETLTRVITSLARLDPAKVAEALRNFGRNSQTLAAVGRLVRRGIEKLKNALDALGRLLGADALEKIKESVEKVWKDAQEHQLTRKALAWVLAVQVAERQVDQSLSQPGLEPAALTRGLEALDTLDSRYRKQMAVVDKMTNALALAASVLTLSSLASSSAPFLAGGYLLLIGSILLIGMDYADSGSALRWVRGVGEIASDLRTPALRP